MISSEKHLSISIFTTFVQFRISIYQNVLQSIFMNGLELYLSTNVIGIGNGLINNFNMKF